MLVWPVSRRMLRGDLGVGAARGDQGDEFLFPGAEAAQFRRCLGRILGGDDERVLGRRIKRHRGAAFLGRGSGLLLARLRPPAGLPPVGEGPPARRRCSRGP